MIVSRRYFLQRSGWAGAAALMPSLLGGCRSVPSRPVSRPNVLFILSDDHGYQALSCYDGRLNQTPNIDRLAREGVRFTQSFCTNSICAPSRAVILTGKYGHLNGVTDNAQVFDGGQITFPKLLQRAGYQTGLFGKWHLKSDPTGFDHWSILPGQGDYYNPDMIEMGERKKRSGYVTDIIADDALSWLKGRNPARPFCLLLHNKAPHRNWMPDEKHLDMYAGETKPLPETFYDDYATRSAAAREQEMRIADHMTLGYDLKLGPPDDTPEDDSEVEAKVRKEWQGILSRMTPEERAVFEAAYREDNRHFWESRPEGPALAEWKYQRYIKDYLRCIASVDENVGRVLDYLEAEGLSENTIVIYTSDQGFYLGEHGWFDKRFMYEQSLRMPLLVRYPEEIRPAVNDADMVLNLDLAPTILDYAGIDPPSEMQGRSLRAVLSGDTPSDWRQSVYYHYYEYPGVHAVKRHYGVRTKRYKLIHFYNDIDAWELYDLQEDPRELHNFYNEHAYEGVVRTLKDELDRLRSLYKDSEGAAKKSLDRALRRTRRHFREFQMDQKSRSGILPKQAAGWIWTRPR